jgi:hypothetical protein
VGAITGWDLLGRNLQIAVKTCWSIFPNTFGSLHAALFIRGNFNAQQLHSLLRRSCVLALADGGAGPSS